MIDPTNADAGLTVHARGPKPTAAHPERLAADREIP